MPRPLTFGILSFALAALFAAACHAPSSGGGLLLTELPTVTVLESGATTGQNVVGKKRVSVRIAPGQNALLADGSGVTVFYGLSRSTLRSGQATRTGPGGRTYAFDLPGSETLDLCDKMLYRWTVVYENAATGARGTYVGEDRYVRPDVVVEGGTIRRVPCAD
jgi:hypothetical protein